jgi:Flp pilus assembly protein TadB
MLAGVSAIVLSLGMAAPAFAQEANSDRRASAANNTSTATTDNSENSANSDGSSAANNGATSTTDNTDSMTVTGEEIFIITGLSAC